MDKPDPITPLTPAEKKLVAWLDEHSSRKEVLAELQANLQTAIEIELATIPIYLYTYYSLVRNNESGEAISDAQLFANKAGGVIMSVAVEEMLHMSLSSNVLFAMGGGAAALRQGARALSDRPCPITIRTVRPGPTARPRC